MGGSPDIVCVNCGRRFGKRPSEAEFCRAIFIGPVCKPCALKIDRPASPKIQKPQPKYCPKCSSRLGMFHDISAGESCLGCLNCMWREMPTLTHSAQSMCALCEATLTRKNHTCQACGFCRMCHIMKRVGKCEMSGNDMA